MAYKINGVFLDTSVLDRMTAEMKPNARKIVNKHGLVIVGLWAKDVRVDTGAYKNSITSESKMTGELQFTAQDGVTYGVFNELGTSKMAAKPSLTQAIEQETDPFLDEFKELFK